ncbi:MAG: hypothetical protein C0482_05075 [Gordonia sp.]|nr:hypothetical protein [Gordonia sp. (in: high G+C Gram-positive bacteria)]
MPIKPSDRTMKAVVANAEAGSIVLPNFQREYVWKAVDQKSLAASVLLEVPAGALLLLRGTTHDYSFRRIGRREAENQGGDAAQCEYLLDGQQRLSTLQVLFGDPLSDSKWPEPMEGKFSALIARFALRVKPAEDSDLHPDLFGLSALQFQGLQPDTDLIADAIERISISKIKNSDEWYHPSFKSDLGMARRNLEIGSHAAARGFVPLWEVLASDLSKTTSALGHSLQTLADNRRNELLADYRDKKLTDFAEQQLLLPGEVLKDLTDDIVDDRLRDRRSQWVQDVYSFLAGVRNFQFATIELDAEEISKAIIIFGAINRGGSPLTPFDLVSAKYAALKSAKSFPEMITERLEKFPTAVPEALMYGNNTHEYSVAAVMTQSDGSLSTSFRKQFLQVLALDEIVLQDPTRTLQVVDIKQERVLKLTPHELDTHWGAATDGLARAWQFLQLRCGVKSESALRNKLLLLPLAVALSDRRVSPNQTTYRRLEYWYWSSVLTNTYTSRQNDFAVHDTSQLLQWLAEDSADPFESRRKRVLNDPGYSDRATLLREDGGAGGVGTDVDEYLLQLVLALGGMDLIQGRRLHAATDDLHDHHLIPLGTATTIGQSSREIRKSKSSAEGRLLNSPLNRAYILDSTNLAIGSTSLGQYMSQVSHQVKSSLYFGSADDFVIKHGDSYLEDVAKLLRDRFDRIETQVTNHLSQLLH